MENITLTRISQSNEGTFGMMDDEDGNQLCVTIEPPPDIQHPCIPAGIYDCIPHNGERWKHVWEITNVPGRSSILIHAGNTDADTRGCVVVGTKVGELNGNQAVLESLNALNKLRAELPDNFTITITDDFNH